MVQMLGVIFHLDTDPMYVSVPEDKVEKAVHCIQQVQGQNWAPAVVVTGVERTSPPTLIAPLDCYSCATASTSRHPV